MSLAIQTPLQFISSAKTLSGGTIPTPWLSLTTKLTHLSLDCPKSIPFRTTPIWMACPRISPGGVTKMKWRTMQAKKAKQLHETGLARERQIYKMRKRAELRAAVIELERPWETVEKPPNLLYVSADEQLVDGGLHSSSFSPEGVGKKGKMITVSKELQSPCLDVDSRPDPINTSVGNSGLQRNGRYKTSRSSRSALDKGGSMHGFRSRGLDDEAKNGASENFMGKVRKQRSRKTYLSDSKVGNSLDSGFHRRNGTDGRIGG